MVRVRLADVPYPRDTRLFSCVPEEETQQYLTLTQSDGYLVRIPPETKKRFRMQDRCRVPCGKGSENCLGQALATAELLSTMGNIFWRFNILVMVVDE